MRLSPPRTRGSRGPVGRTLSRLVPLRGGVEGLQRLALRLSLIHISEPTRPY